MTRLLRSIGERLAFLERQAEADAAQRSQETWLPAVKYAFITLIESCIDVAQHISSVEHLGTPRNNGDAMRRLGEHGVIAPELALGMTKAVGFRNVLVHEYFEVDDSIVLHRLESHQELSEFLEQVAQWLEARN